MLRRISLGAFLVCVATTAWAQAPEEKIDGDKVIENYLKALGGRSVLEKIKDRTSQGQLKVMGMTGTMEMHEKIPTMNHMLVDMGMAKVEIWFDGEQGFRNDPMKGAGRFSKEEVEEAKQSPVIFPLLTYKQRGLTAKFVGTRKIEEKDLFAVEISGAAGKEPSTYLFDQSYLLVRQISPLPSGEGKGTQELAYSDYREVEGVKFPFRIARTTSSLSTEMVFESIKVNSGLEDSVFRHVVD